MPRAYTEQELSRIRRTLLEKGRERFQMKGLSKTTISDLCDDANIGKGGFYKFFPSKEELFLAISRLEEQRFRQELLDELAGNTNEDLVRGLLEAPSRRLREHPFLGLLLQPETLTELTVRLGAERMKEELEGDREFFIDLARRWKKMGILKKGVLEVDVFAGLSSLFLVELGRPLMSDEDIERCLATTRSAFLKAWVA